MIVCNLIGGLGNQMFQYACGRALSLHSGQELKLSVDQFETYGMHNGLEIDQVFNCSTEIVDHAALTRLLGWQRRPWIRKLIGRPVMNWVAKPAWRNEPHFHYWSELRTHAESIYMHGYWQSERYFADVQDQIRRDFIFRLDWDDADMAVRELMASGPSLSVHVRRGDYASKKNQAVFAAPGLDYYRAGIRYVRDRVPDIRIFLFSDEPQWAQEQLEPEFGEISVVRHNSGKRSPRDMRLMSLATHHIIANSSFSWWGAWLNASKEKIVVAPRQWFVDEATRSSVDLVPANWIRL